MVIFAVIQPSSTTAGALIKVHRSVLSRSRHHPSDGRRYIAFEREADYAAIAEARLATVEVLDPADIALPETRRSAPKIPIGRLIEEGLLQPGDILVSPCGRHAAKVRIDGTVISAEHKGSIHQVGVAVQGAPSCNGWTYWVVKSTGVALDVLRQKLRADMAARPTRTI